MLIYLPDFYLEGDGIILINLLLCLGIWCSRSVHQTSRKLGSDVSRQKMKHPGVLVPKLAWRYSRVMLASLTFSFCFVSLHLIEGKAEIQTIIVDDLARSLFQNAFIFHPLFFGVTVAQFECAIVLF